MRLFDARVKPVRGGLLETDLGEMIESEFRKIKQSPLQYRMIGQTLLR